MKIKHVITVALLLITTLNLSAQNSDIFKRGAGEFDYSSYAPLSDKPIKVFYYVPSRGDVKKMTVLFSMHGAERSGLTQRGVWRNLAEDYGFIVIAPQFLHKDGYKENDYQFGGVSEDPKVFKGRPEEQWTYQLIENLFDYFLTSTGSKAKTYKMFGHSAGGQFVHRYLLMMPNARVEKAFAANPGNYTYPDEKGIFSASGKLANPSGWPFSFKGTDFATNERLAAFYKRKLIIGIGTNDTARIDLKKTPETDPSLIQGINRYERALKYFATNQATAKAQGLEFNWKLLEVNEAGHSSAHMIYGSPKLRNWRVENNERVYNNKDLTNNGAFKVLIEDK